MQQHVKFEGSLIFLVDLTHTSFDGVLQKPKFPAWATSDNENSRLHFMDLNLESLPIICWIVILSIDKDLKSVGLDTGLIHQLNELKFLLRFLRFGNPRLLLQ